MDAELDDDQPDEAVALTLRLLEHGLIPAAAGCLDMVPAEAQVITAFVADEAHQQGLDASNPDVLDVLTTRMLNQQRRLTGRSAAPPPGLLEVMQARWLDAIDTLVMRTRNWSQLVLMREAGIDDALCVLTRPDANCPTCRGAEGLRVNVESFCSALDQLWRLSPANAEHLLRSVGPADIAAARGRTCDFLPSPPWHARCNCLIEADL